MGQQSMFLLTKNHGGGNDGMLGSCSLGALLLSPSMGRAQLAPVSHNLATPGQYWPFLPSHAVSSIISSCSCCSAQSHGDARARTPPAGCRWHPRRLQPWVMDRDCCQIMGHCAKGKSCWYMACTQAAMPLGKQIAVLQSAVEACLWLCFFFCVGYA